jgi:hypothetical protein
METGFEISRLCKSNRFFIITNQTMFNLVTTHADTKIISLRRLISSGRFNRMQEVRVTFKSSNLQFCVFVIHICT